MEKMACSGNIVFYVKIFGLQFFRSGVKIWGDGMEGKFSVEKVLFTFEVILFCASEAAFAAVGFKKQGPYRDLMDGFMMGFIWNLLICLIFFILFLAKRKRIKVHERKFYILHFLIQAFFWSQGIMYMGMM